MKRTAAIVVTYNRKELLKENIEKLLAQSFKSRLDIIIIDNASTDGTKEYVGSFIDKKEIKYINTGENLGGAGGFHYGIKYAVENNYDFVWVMDDDCMPKEKALEEFYRWDKKLNGKYGFLSSKVLWKDGSICTMNVQKETKWKRLKNFDRIRQIQYASFVSLFLKSETVRKVGLPYKDFFIWADDWEYTRRISKREKCYFIPSSIADHFSGSNVGADIITSPKDRIDRFNYMYRNDVVLYRQDGIEGRIYLGIRNMVHRLRIILKAKDKKRKFEIIRKGTKEGKKFFPEIEYPNLKRD
ncbi:Glycosyltransferase, GT2 family [Ruminococcus flavefaciens]|uniref:Glycosyltransferase, GT2 family n=1 Tax=Ruminococcus flavefaciens TaxID=1265 RepID=A0A1H6IIP7_RUMFL|nr:glycosyltransferase family 2 protein [Ruminococcus flavefaciens]SEH46402.1 Glycosyltransferase, GT2 family [Ruminococcus flavefaciens]